eukprot:CAMPEP_0176225880 /NCGR_PEP_ID=MMETSP0121_2-20121125/21980_1 /TAXON_ID=160619 /ORGANISM="Kryptoperidinium foliaceum, Strain CCMP 1326" /LENGTH=60 /DNA_ID=CAMNT_0017565143 /DNA_START=31 /DNA_END=213 /DNA_ORIENTATION=+
MAELCRVASCMCRGLCAHRRAFGSEAAWSGSPTVAPPPSFRVASVAAYGACTSLAQSSAG